MPTDEEASSQTPSGQSQPSTGNTPQPAAGLHSSSGLRSKTNQTLGSTGSSSASGPPSGSQYSKRRRGLGVVTPNACTECRKKRAKCDGHNPCGRCKSQKDVECVYEIPVRQSKENLRTEIENLRLRQRSSDRVFSALGQPELWEEVLTRLRGGQSVDTISEWLDSAVPSSAGLIHQFPNVAGSEMNAASSIPNLSGFDASGSESLAAMNIGVNVMAPMGSQQAGMRPNLIQGSPWHFSAQSQTGSTESGSHPDTMNWTADIRGAPQSRLGSLEDGMFSDEMSEAKSKLRGLELVLSPLNDPGTKSLPETWTSITGDQNLVHHLLALYFCWEYPTFASLSKEHFLLDFQGGRHRYCSPILVNALLSLGCRFSTQPMTRANPDDPYTSGDHFFKESQRLFNQETDHHTLTTIQALGIMSIREASCGRDSESWYYAGQSIRLAIEMGLHRIEDEGDEDEVAVQSATFWGAFALDHAWSLATGSLPQCSCFPHLPPKPGIIGDIEASLWVPYTDDGAPLQRSCEQPSNVRSVYKCFCELSELVHQSLYILHSPGKPLTARELLAIYTQYLNWYDRIPEVLRLGHNFTPAVLFAHMYYHFAILLLFRPLIKLRIIGSKVCPRDVCSQAADAIQGLLTSYSQLYTLTRTPSFVPYFVLTSSIVHLAIGAATVQGESGASGAEKMQKAARVEPRILESLGQGIAYLTEMAPCHHFAEQALNILKYLAKKWNLDVDIKGGKTLPDDCDRLVKPYTTSLNFFAPNVLSEDFISEWGNNAIVPELGHTGSTSVQKAAESIENPLFWPFPMQGRPIIANGKELEEAGFAML